MSIDTNISFWLSVVFIVGGLYVLAKSADMFVDASSSVAQRFGISPLIVGMVIIGFGTSAPELAVSAISAAGGHPGLSLGNAYGSCTFNIAGILGVAALMRPLAVKPSVNGVAVPLLIGITALCAFLLKDGCFSRCDGILLLALFAAILPLYCWYDQKSSAPKQECCGEPDCKCQEKRALWIEWLRLLSGLALLVSSSHILVWGSVDFARDVVGASDLLIGLTIVAIGTSLPELAAAVASVRKGENEFVIGNIIGSNLFNMLAVVGLAGTIWPFDGFSRFILLRDIPMMLIMTSLILVFSINFKCPKKIGYISRFSGALWILIFVAYSVLMMVQELPSS
jgi:cation:H+ antiporter